jgi:hypothetical protein
MPATPFFFPSFPAMRLTLLLPGVVLATFPLMAQQPAAPANRSEDLRKSVREWIETMREVQKEENGWDKDREILKGYKEGLEKEIEDLKEQIARARTEREGADKEDLDKIAQRDAYAKAKESLAKGIREMENGLLVRLKRLPAPLLAEPKVAQFVEEITKDAGLPADRAHEGLSKRLNNVLNMLTEVEKFQQTVVVRPQIHKASDGKEYKLQFIYFGMGAAYAVNDEGDYALTGVPTDAGWHFTERNDLAPRIKELLGVTTGDLDAKFVTLPIDLP